MKLINHKNTIYLEFISSSKVIKKSLKLPYNAKNLAYATKTLLPIFQKLYEVKSTKSLQKAQTNKSKISRTALSKFCEISLNELKFHSKTTTINSAIYAYKRLFDFLDDKAIHLYTHAEIQLAVFKMSQTLSPRTIHLIISYLNLAFKKALNLGIITKNPALNLKKTRILRTHKALFTKAQILSLLKNAKDDLKLFLYIAFYTGARSGEILALTKDDINLQNLTILISKNQTRFELTTPKNGNSRLIHIPNNS